ncbi:unnamed protein product [Trichobilharzia regenti]|uniref:Uncharacterized protein n=1 Tax=Trichobilharzia regenti TaxID=157069 RepID=A0A183X3P7_TRIRE|nr:unnamed protein product [Trichobilharzia regenti]VDQ14881.1 unnamed protein product [Trichobilharzia regenti]
MRSFSDSEIQGIVRIQACIRGILTRKRFQEALRQFRNVALDCGESEESLNNYCSKLNYFNKYKTHQVNNDRSCEKSKLPELYALRNSLFLEAIWLDQAICSRRNFLMYKQNIMTHFNQ